MARSFVFAVIGRDRPGLVETMSDIVVAHGGNWLDSRMISLADQFVGVALVTVPEENTAAFTEALKKLDSGGLRVMLEPTGERAMPEAAPKLAIRLMGHDRPGIVREISRVLHKHNVNISELTTGTARVPMSGDTFFRASAELQVQPGFQLEKLRGDLEALSHEIMVDFELEEHEP